MGVIINYTGCTDSHLDYFARNLIVCKGDNVATAHGYISAERITDAQTEPIEVDAAKEYIRFPIDERDQDGNVQTWIKAARQKLEKDIGVALLPQTWRATIEQFPSYRQSLYLPVWPVQSITSFVYVDRDGATQDLILSPSNFILASRSRPAQLGLIETATWPTDFRKFHPGTLEFVAGWSQVDDIPADLIMAMLKLIGDFAGFRESSIAGQSMAPVPQSYDELIAPWILPGIA